MVEQTNQVLSSFKCCVVGNGGTGGKFDAGFDGVVWSDTVGWSAAVPWSDACVCSDTDIDVLDDLVSLGVVLLNMKMR